jgi:hypothetical protein
MLLYIAYLMVTVPLLVGRLKGRTLPDGVDEDGRPLFSLGRAGTVVNIVAVAYGALMTINLGWPRAEVYDPAGEGWYLHYLPLIALAVTAVGGVVAYLGQRTAYHRAIGDPVAPLSLPHPQLGGAIVEEEA